MIILLTRPEPDASATALRLAELGHRVITLPATEIVATHTPLPPGPFTALLATSANSFRMMAHPDIASLKSIPLHCVGEKTAKIARDMGFVSVTPAGGSGTKLVAAILSLYPPSANLLYLTGIPRKPIVEDRLHQAGYRLMTVELYKAQPVAAWPERQMDALPNIDVALHFSRASVEVLLDAAAQSGVLPMLRNIRHLCLSEDVAAPLKTLNLPFVHIADEASENSLLAMLGSVSR